MRHMCVAVVLSLVSALGLSGCGEEPEHLLEQGRIALDNGRPDLAFEDAKKVLYSDPDNVDALLLRAEALLHLEQFDNSLRTLDRVAEHAPQSPAMHALKSEWAVRNAQRLLRSEILPGSELEQDFELTLALGAEQAQWLKANEQIAEAAYVLARLEESQAMRYHTLATDPLLESRRLTHQDESQEPSAQNELHLSREEYEALMHEHLSQAAEHLARGFEADPRHLNATQMYVRLLLQQQQWAAIWSAALRLSELDNLPPGVVDSVVVALITIPEDQRGSEPVHELGMKLRTAIAPASRETVPALLTTARLMMLEERWEPAQTVLRQAMRVRQSDRDATYLLALCHFRLQQFEDAATLLTSLSNVMPNSANVQSLFGRALLAKGDIGAARQPLDQAMQLNPNDPVTRQAYMQVLVRSGQLTEAEPYIAELYEANPNEPFALGLMMQLLRSRDDQAGVRRLLAHAETIVPLSESHLGILIEGYRALGDFEQVETHARRLIQKQPDTVEGRIALVEALFAQEKRDEAAELLEQVAAEQPNHPALQVLRGRQRLISQDFDEAIAALQTAVANQPRNVQARIMLAHALAGAARMPEAVTHIEEALMLAPNSVPARDTAIRIYHLLGRQDKVAENLQQVDASRLTESDWPVLLAMTRLSQGQLNEAEGICQRSLQHGNDDPLLRLILSAIHEQRRDLAQAEEHLLAFLRHQPGSTQAYRTFASFFARHDMSRRGIEHLQTFEDEQPTLAKLAKASLYVELDEPQAAVAELSPLLEALLAERAPIALMVAQTLASAQVKLNEVPAAVASLEQLVRADLFPQEAMLLQVDILRDHGQSQAARVKLDALMATINPDRRTIAMEVLKRLVEAGAYDVALAKVDEWMKQSAHAPMMRVWKAELLAQLGRDNEAMNAYTAAISDNPRDISVRQGLAAVQMNQRDYPGAEATLMRMGELGYEAQIDSLIDMGRMFLTLGLNERARHTFERLEQEAAPDDQDALLAAAEGWLAMGDWRRAYDRLKSIHRMAGQFPAAQALMAQIELSRGRADDAGQRLRYLAENPVTAARVVPIIMTLEPHDPVHHDLIRWYDATVAVDRLPLEERQQWLAMRLYMHANRDDWRQTLEAARQLAELLPRTDILGMMFVLHVRLDELDEARQLYETDPAIGRSPHGALAAMLINREPSADAPAINDVARYIAAMMRGDVGAARVAAESLQPHRTVYRRDLLEAMDVAPAASTQSMEAHRQLALALLAADFSLPQLSRHLARQVIETQPQTATAYGLLTLFADEAPVVDTMPAGMRLYHAARQAQIADNYADNIRHLQQLLEREPEHYFVRYLLGQAHERAGDFDRAIALYEQVWKMNSPAQQGVGNDLAYLLSEHQPSRLNEAHEIARRVLAMEPAFPSRAYLLDTLGWIEHKRGNDREALPMLQQAIPYLRQHPEAHEHIAAVYRQLNQSAWAQYHEEQAQALRANN